MANQTAGGRNQEGRDWTDEGNRTEENDNDIQWTDTNVGRLLIKGVTAVAPFRIKGEKYG